MWGRATASHQASFRVAAKGKKGAQTTKGVGWVEGKGPWVVLFTGYLYMGFSLQVRVWLGCSGQTLVNLT